MYKRQKGVCSKRVSGSVVLEAFSSRARFICTTVVQIGVADMFHVYVDNLSTKYTGVEDCSISSCDLQVFSSGTLGGEPRPTSHHI